MNRGCGIQRHMSCQDLDHLPVMQRVRLLVGKRGSSTQLWLDAFPSAASHVHDDPAFIRGTNPRLKMKRTRTGENFNHDSYTMACPSARTQHQLHISKELSLALPQTSSD